ncbi:MAG: BolA family transcriptional regulator [Alphaproteobacteria bacterium]|nr:BolA family transcriptional regulator [Alphaproteobacteria bacterium]
MDRAARIRRLLQAGFNPTHLEVRDESALHADHAAAMPEGQTHYHVIIAAPELQHMPRVAAHRLVKKALAEEFAQGLHALRIEIRMPAGP